MSTLYAVLGLVAAQRVAELALAAGNTRRLRAQGAIEVDSRGYPAFVVLHGSWLVTLAALVPGQTDPSWPILACFGLLQLMRLRVIISLGRRWTTRLLVQPGTPVVRSGPYRWCRHPNYAIVALEIPLLPLAFGAGAIALLFSIANLLLLARRIRLENAALREGAPPHADMALAAPARPGPGNTLRPG